MDYALLTIAVGCWIAGGIRRPFLRLVAAEFAVCVALVAGQGWFPADYWFLAFALVNCAFAWLMVRLGHRLSREYAATLLLSAVLAVLVFIGYVIQWRAPYDARGAVMAVICTYQLWLAANDAGTVQGTLTGAARGIFAACAGRGRRAVAGYSSGNLDNDK
jgi:hypothetical protein